MMRWIRSGVGWCGGYARGSVGGVGLVLVLGACVGMAGCLTSGASQWVWMCGVGGVIVLVV